MEYEINKILTVSTAHVTEKDSGLLEATKNYQPFKPINYGYDYGAFV